jgi:hypothetical protein
MGADAAKMPQDVGIRATCFLQGIGQDSKTCRIEFA